MNGKCKLCGTADSPLVKSHVIPRSLYGDALTDELGPAQIITDKPDQHPRKTRTGIYSEDVVCIECEKIFGPWDDYANKLLFQTKPDSVIDYFDEPCAYVYDKYNYTYLKLFYLSLLWRAHHSAHDLFEGVDLQPKMERQLQAMILNEEPGEPETFSVVIARFDDPLANGFLHPFHERYDGVGTYRVFFSQHASYIKVSTQRTCDVFRPFILRPNSRLVVFARDFSSSKEKRAMIDVVRKIPPP